MFETIKSYLLDNIELIVEILKELGFHDINDSKKDRITCALPDGDNYTSVVIYKDSLVTRVHSRNDFLFEAKDFISLVAYVVGGIPKALSYLSYTLGITDEVSSIKKSDALRLIKSHIKKESLNQPDSAIDEYLLKQKKPYIVKEWLDEGIDEEAQKEFEVYIDIRYKRWGFPLRDFDGKLIGFNGRTYVKDFEVLRIPKYFKTTHFPLLFNVHRAREHIKKLNEVIVVEGEKSCMKLWSMGIFNVVALGTSNLCKETESQLLSLGCDNIIFSFDKGVELGNIKQQTSRLQRFRNIYTMIDEWNLLDKKDAPCDKGYLSWITIYENRKKVK